MTLELRSVIFPGRLASVFELLHLQMILEIGKDVESCMASFKEGN